MSTVLPPTLSVAFVIRFTVVYYLCGFYRWRDFSILQIRVGVSGVFVAFTVFCIVLYFCILFASGSKRITDFRFGIKRGIRFRGSNGKAAFMNSN